MEGFMTAGSRTMLLAALLAGVVTSTAVAQHRPRHDRFWFGFGLGGGWNAFNIDLNEITGDWRFDFDGPRGAAGYVRMGGTVNQHVLFGGEALVFWRDESANEIDRVNVTATALIYPGPNGGFFVKGGFGVASREDDHRDESGVGANVGAGYDLRIGNNWFVTPNLDFMLQAFEENTNASVLFTLGFTWH
jgi:hypothetical protein